MKRVLLALVAVGGVVAAPAAPAAAAEGRSVSVAPRTGTWFTIELAPGEQYRGEVVITNLLDERLDGFLYAADGFSTPQGGFALHEREARGEAVALWADVPPRRVLLAPRQSRIVSFTLTVPPTAEPGDYFGGVVFERDRQESNASPAASAKVGLIERVGARIYLSVAGERRPSLSILGVARRGSTFGLTVRNDGNVRLNLDASIVLTSTLGRRAQVELNAAEPLYPQQSVTIHGPWMHPGLLGRFGLRATVAYEGGTASRAASFWLIPWRLLLFALAGLGLFGYGTVRTVRWIRRARRALRLEKQQAAVIPDTAAASPVPVVDAEPEQDLVPTPSAPPPPARAHAAVRRKPASRTPKRPQPRAAAGAGSKSRTTRSSRTTGRKTPRRSAGR